jgi:hypothetical protein
MFQCYTKFDVHQIAKKKKKPIVASIVDFFNSGVPWKKKKPYSRTITRGFGTLHHKGLLSIELY